MHPTRVLPLYQEAAKKTSGYLPYVNTSAKQAVVMTNIQCRSTRPWDGPPMSISAVHGSLELGEFGKEVKVFDLNLRMPESAKIEPECVKYLLEATPELVKSTLRNPVDPTDAIQLYDEYLEQCQFSTKYQTVLVGDSIAFDYLHLDYWRSKVTPGCNPVYMKQKTREFDEPVSITDVISMYRARERLLWEKRMKESKMAAVGSDVKMPDMLKPGLHDRIHYDAAVRSANALGFKHGKTGLDNCWFLYALTFIQSNYDPDQKTGEYDVAKLRADGIKQPPPARLIVISSYHRRIGKSTQVKLLARSLRIGGFIGPDILKFPGIATRSLRDGESAVAEDIPFSPMSPDLVVCLCRDGKVDANERGESGMMHPDFVGSARVIVNVDAAGSEEVVAARVLKAATDAIVMLDSGTVKTQVVLSDEVKKKEPVSRMIVVTGLRKIGKSTQIRRLAASLKAKDYHSGEFGQIFSDLRDGQLKASTYGRSVILEDISVNPKLRPDLVVGLYKGNDLDHKALREHGLLNFAHLTSALYAEVSGVGTEDEVAERVLKAVNSALAVMDSIGSGSAAATAANATGHWSDMTYAAAQAPCPLCAIRDDDKSPRFDTRRRAKELFMAGEWYSTLVRVTEVFREANDSMTTREISDHFQIHDPDTMKRAPKKMIDSAFDPSEWMSGLGTGVTETTHVTGEVSTEKPKSTTSGSAAAAASSL